MLSFFPWIDTRNETGSPSDVLGPSLAFYRTIISALKLFTRSSLTKALFLFIIEALIVCSNDHENMMLHANFYYSKGDYHWFSVYHKGSVVGNSCSNIYPSLYLLTLFSSIYSTFIEWMHVLLICQIRKFQHQIRVALCRLLMVLNIYQIQPGSCIIQVIHVG